MSQIDPKEQDIPRVFVTKYGEDEEEDYVDMMPPKSWKDNCSTSICGKFAHSSVNKMKYPVNCAIWTPDGRRLITGLQSGEFSLWNGSQFNFETILNAHNNAVRYKKKIYSSFILEKEVIFPNISHSIIYVYKKKGACMVSQR